jgi:hypothetical protein
MVRMILVRELHERLAFPTRIEDWSPINLQQRRVKAGCHLLKPALCIGGSLWQKVI